MQFAQGLRAAKLAVALTAALAITGCAKNAADEAAGGANQFGAGNGRGGANTPGSAQDFVVNVGDRVFFETDSTDLTSTAQATLDKQVVAEPLSALRLHRRRPRRRARHARI